MRSRLVPLVVLAAVLVGCVSSEPAPRLHVHVVRLAPGDDLKVALEKLVREQSLEAAFVLSCAGSLTRAVIRFADKKETTTVEEKLEIVSLTGTLSASGGSHLHLAVANGEGRTVGGHLKEGSLVYTTAEVAVGVAPDLRFTRTLDARTGYPELVVQRAEVR